MRSEVFREAAVAAEQVAPMEMEVTAERLLSNGGAEAAATAAASMESSQPGGILARRRTAAITASVSAGARAVRRLAMERRAAEAEGRKAAMVELAVPE